MANKRSIARMKGCFDRGDASLILGAGVSKPFGIPDWPTLLSAIVDNLHPDIAVRNDILSANPNPVILARYIRDQLKTESEFNMSVHRALYQNYTADFDNQNMKSIVKYVEKANNGKYHKRIITYNFDHVLQEWIRLVGVGIKYYTTDFAYDETEDGGVEIFHCHGSLPLLRSSIRGSRIIFDESEYHELNYDHYNRSNIIQFSTFLDRSCVFVGISMTDPNVRRLLDYANRQRPGMGRHFIFRRVPDSKLLDGDDKRSLRERRKLLKTLFETDAKALGLTTVWVKNYNEIGEILGDLI